MIIVDFLITIVNLFTIIGVFINVRHYGFPDSRISPNR